MNIEQRALKTTRNTLSYRLLELHIAWRRLIYGLYHDKTKQLVRKRNLIDFETIQQLRDANRHLEVLRGEVKLMSGEDLEREANNELDELLHKIKGE